MKFIRYCLAISVLFLVLFQDFVVAANFFDQNEIRQTILNFFVAASKDPTQRFFFDNINHRMTDEERFQHFSKYLPEIPAELSEVPNLFIEALKNLGFWDYRKGKNGFFSFYEFSDKINQYARFFAKYPYLMTEVNSHFRSSMKYKSQDDVVPIRALCADLGLDPDEYFF